MTTYTSEMRKTLVSEEDVDIFKKLWRIQSDCKL